MTKDYQLDITLKEVLWTEVFSESYKIALLDEFVKNTNPKEHGFKNHEHGFVMQLFRNNKPSPAPQTFAKRQVFVVSYGMNTGSEVNGERPSIIFKADHSTKWDDIIVIPLTSALQQKQSDRYDVLVSKDNDNNLFQNSFARIRQMRAVSLKRVGKQVGTITDPQVMQAITAWAQTMLWMEAQENPSE